MLTGQETDRVLVYLGRLEQSRRIAAAAGQLLIHLLIHNEHVDKYK